MEMEEVPLKELDEAEFGSRELIPETGGSIPEGTICYS